MSEAALLGDIQRLLASSKVLDDASKRAWENTLPHMTPEQKQQLLELLRREEKSKSASSP